MAEPQRPHVFSTRAGQWCAFIGGNLLLAAVYFGAGRLGLSLGVTAKQVSPVWPPTGIALAAVVLLGYRILPGIALGAFLVNIISDEPVSVALGITAGNTLEALTGAWLLLRFARFDGALERLRDVLALVALSAVVSTLLSATIGVTSLCAGGVKPWSIFGRLWSEWWLGDAMGSLVMAPVLLTWATRPRRQLPGELREGLLLLVCLLLTSSLVFIGQITPHIGSYSIFPFIVWAALRFEQRGTTVVTFLVSAIAITGVVMGRGPFSNVVEDERLLLLQVFMGVVAITGLLLGAALTERRRAAESKRKAEDVTRALAEAGTMAEAAPRIIAAICDNFEWRVGAVWQLDQAAEVMRCVDVGHSGPRMFPRFEDTTRQREFPKGVGLPGRVWASRQPVWIADVVEDANFPRASIAHSEGLHGAFAFPIELSGEVLGVVEFFSPEILQPDDELLRMIEGVGSQIGQFIERRRAEASFRETAQRMRQIVDSAYDTFVAMDSRGRITGWNAQAEALLGWSQQEAMGRSLADTIIPPRFRQAHADGLARFLATGEGPMLGRRIELAVLARDGREIPVELMVSVIRTGDDFFFSAFMHDITERQKTEGTFRFLAEASAALATLVDYESTLKSVAELSVSYFADWCVVDVLQPDGSLHRVAVSHRDQEKIRLVEELVRRYPDAPESGAGPRHVLATGQSECFTDIPESLLRQVARDDEHFQLLCALGLRSALCVPLFVRGKPFGAVTFVTAESGRRYGPEDLKIAEDLVHRASVAMDNAQLYAEVRQADRRKDEFLAMLAHELRNPLAPIRSGLDLLRLKGDDPETAAWVHETMDQQVKHMVRLVDDLMDVSRIMRGKVQLRPEPVEISTIVARAVEVARPLIDAQRHELIVELPRDVIWIQADPVRMTQVVANLLNNAAKYTDQAGKIHLVVELRDGQVVVCVTDTGIGLTPEMQQHVFDLFAQADRSAERTQGGLGIGLTLVRSLMEMHGGRVEVASEGLAKGSRFTVILPAQMILKAEDGTRRTPTMRQAAPKRVLVVDDNKDAATMVARLLQAWGHTVETAYDGPAALTAADAFQPEIVLLDIGLPGISGYDVARQLRRQPSGERLRLIALTGYGQQEDRQRSRDAGFDLHLVKPLAQDDLQQAIDAQ